MRKKTKHFLNCCIAVCLFPLNPYIFLLSLSLSLSCVSNSDGIKPTVIAIIIGPIVFAYGSLNAAAILHHNLLNRILNVSQQFFDTTPSGRILARFSSDLYTVDSVLPMKMKQIIIFFFRVGVRSVIDSQIKYMPVVFLWFVLLCFDPRLVCIKFPFFMSFWCCKNVLD